MILNHTDLVAELTGITYSLIVMLSRVEKDAI
jgi:hypothetical protein